MKSGERTSTTITFVSCHFFSGFGLRLKVANALAVSAAKNLSLVLIFYTAMHYRERRLTGEPAAYASISGVQDVAGFLIMVKKS